MVPSDENSNVFNISITQPVDVERTPRHQIIDIKGQYAVFYRRDGQGVGPLSTYIELKREK